MPIRFPTEAANDPGRPEKSDDLPQAGTDRTPGRHSRTGAGSRSSEARPGKDINQAGFVRERRDTEPER